MDLNRTHPTDLNALLVREAQQDAANLRSELFTARRAAEERRQSVERLEQMKAQLEMTVREQQAELNRMAGQLHELGGFHQHCQQLEAMVMALQQENMQLKESNKKALEEAKQAARGKQAAENSKALLEGERSRLAKSRDELATQLRVAQQRARDADEEQLRAEEEAAALRAELQVYQADGQQPDAYDGMNTGASADLLAQLDCERENRLAMFDSLQAAKAELSQKDVKLAALQGEVRTLRDDLAAARQQHDQDASHGSEVSEMAQRLEQAQRELAESQRELSQAEQELVQSRQRQQALETQTQKLKAHILQLQSTSLEVPDPPPAHAPNPTSSTSNGHVPHTRPSRSDSSSTLGADEDAGSGAAAKVKLLERKVNMFKKSRDKLLAEVDRQSAELDRLSLENKALQEEMGQLRGFSHLWEVQAQSSIQKLDHLKDLLEESAQWESSSSQQPDISHADFMTPGRQAHANSSGSQIRPDYPISSTSSRAEGSGVSLSLQRDSTGGESENGSLAHHLQSLLLREQARSAKLDVQVRALCAELLKAQKSNVTLLKTRAPVLASIESRVAQLHRAAVV